jgi:hypothetical protein
MWRTSHPLAEVGPAFRLHNQSSHRRGGGGLPWVRARISWVVGGRRLARPSGGGVGRGCTWRTSHIVAFTGFSAVFVYKTHLLTWRTSHIVVFTGFSAVFVYETHLLTVGYVEKVSYRGFHWSFGCFRIKPIFSRGELLISWLSLDFRLFSSIKPIFSPQDEMETLGFSGGGGTASFGGTGAGAGDSVR